MCVCAQRCLKQCHIWWRPWWDGDREGHRHVFPVWTSPGALFWQGKSACVSVCLNQRGNARGVFLGPKRALTRPYKHIPETLYLCTFVHAEVTALCFCLSAPVPLSTDITYQCIFTILCSDYVTSALTGCHLSPGSHWVYSQQKSGGTEQAGKVTHHTNTHTHIIQSCCQCGCMFLVLVPGGWVLLLSQCIDLEA